MKKFLLVMLVLMACTICFSSCGLINNIFPCKHKSTVTDAAIAATCTEYGLTEGSHCEKCGVTVVAQEKIPALGHSEVIDSAVAPTCTTTGLTEGSHCEKCGVTVVAQEKIPALGHSEVIDSAVAPTCTTTGLTEGKHCSVCNIVIVAQAVVPQMHNYGEWTILTEPGCFNEGEKTRTCSICKTKENMNIETLEHSFVQNEETKLFACEHCDARIYAGHLYAAVNIPSHWFEAYEICVSLGGHLVTITSPHEQALVFDMIYQGKTDNGYRKWINEEGYWLGAIKNTSGWEWITGEKFEYSNWDQQEPGNNNVDLFLGMNACGEWHDCSYTHIGSTGLKFICEWELDIVESEHYFTEWEIVTEATCFDDGEQYRICTHCGLEERETIAQLSHNFVFDEAKGITACEHCNAAMYNGHIYKIFTVNLTWFDAYTYCQNLGGHLVTISSEEEQTFIETYMRSQGFTSDPWIGAYTDGVKWQWITDEEWSYTHWLAGEPNCASGYEFFAHISVNNMFGEWNDLSPLDLKYLICEWEVVE